MNTNNGLKLPERSSLEKFASRTSEEKEEFFLLFSKLLAEELKKQQHTSKDPHEPARKPDTRKLSQRPKVEIIDGVKFVTVSKPGGMTIISNAPLRPPQQKAALTGGEESEERQPTANKSLETPRPKTRGRAKIVRVRKQGAVSILFGTPRSE
jgi:hypothetical protein